MFDFIKKLFGKKTKTYYSSKEVEYIIRQILTDTIQRDTLEEILREKLEPIIGTHCIGKVFTSLNKVDALVDKEEIAYWMKKLENLRKEEII